MIPWKDILGMTKFWDHIIAIIRGWSFDGNLKYAIALNEQNFKSCTRHGKPGTHQRKQSSKNIKFTYKIYILIYNNMLLKNKSFLHMLFPSPWSFVTSPHGAQRALAHIDLLSYINPFLTSCIHLYWAFIQLYIWHMTLINLLYSSIWVLFLSCISLFFCFSLHWGDIKADAFANCAREYFCLDVNTHRLKFFFNSIEEFLCL